MGRLRSWLRKDRGAALPEYAMIVGVLGLGLTYGIQTIDEGLEGNYQNDVNDIEAEDYAPTTLDTTTISVTSTTTVSSTTINTTITSTTLASTSSTSSSTTSTTTGGPTTTVLSTTTTSDPCVSSPAALATEDLSYDAATDATKYYAKEGFTVTNSCNGDPVAGAIVSWTNGSFTASCITNAVGYCETPAYLRPDTSSPITWSIASVDTVNGWTGSPTTFVMAQP